MKELLIILLAAIILISGCNQQTTDEVSEIKDNTIVINNFAFEPAELTVNTGTTLTWINNDNAVHTIVSNGLFESKVLNKEEKFSFTFTKPGSYNYYCGIHTSMKGKIIVK